MNQQQVDWMSAPNDDSIMEGDDGHTINDPYGSKNVEVIKIDDDIADSDV